MIKLLSFSAALLLAASVHATSLTNSFDSGPVGTTFGGTSGTVSYLGVTFALNVDGGGTYGLDLTGLDAPPPFASPVLGGDASGTLTLTFADPTPFLTFDVLYIFPTGPSNDSSGEVTIGSTNYTFNTTGNQGLFGFLSIETSNQSFTTGTIPSFTTATISFDPTLPSGTQFAIDNLTYDPVVSPEPAAFSFLLGGLLVIGSRLTLRRPRP